MTDAYIIGWSSTDFTNVLTINRGTNSGIDVNMCAVTANGEVVGLVTQVGPNYAEVKTVLDSTWKSAPPFPPPATMAWCPAAISGAMTSCCG